MRTPLWNKQVLRDKEDEGAGGAEGGSSAPNRIDAVEGRINQMSTVLNEFISGQKSEKQRSEAQTYERGLELRLKDADTSVTQAETALAEAFDTGEGVQIAKAQRHLNEQINTRDQLRTTKLAYEARKRESEHREGGSRGAGAGSQPEIDTTNLNSWKNRHRQWYGIDSDMTKAAHDVSDRIRAAGAIPVGSSEYFETIDREMKNRFPDKFGGTPPTAGGGSSPSGGSPRRGGRIAQSVVEGWRRMGINVDDPKTIERMTKHRETLVDKGILPSEPVADRIITR